ncbi:mitochondrial pyruvate dehydrogenase E1 component beta subunit [Laetiporus sulphureus 93-53]|uniref:Pyruvate dehydrogenase E1 component subunit alpha, mitochondrial n=1 Tax=Laetiporus sulphureus 93-53 TaxID=1314785 RepID=A0A165B341_9APHY|nr:mitochondrial pyruvate dehydrogenase E1 component beta subunit [Laetiporus sulphureus 93-53]KZT00131.1 mitochondrial pyruvate dehydrogenase E1 component beta subunit [Laetiporus sulphureus 93-53]
MASLARLRASLPRTRKTTAADTTQLKEEASHSEPFMVTLHEESFHGFKTDPPTRDLEVTKDGLLKMYKLMSTMRRMEQAADALYKQKLIRGFCHLAIGQEADNIISPYRTHSFAILRGGSVFALVSELLGRKTGISKGKDGSMHVFTESFQGGHGIVGVQVPLGAGLAFAAKYLEKPIVTNQGQVFEAFNMAKLWNLPCVFVCENNKYGMGTLAERSSSNTQYYTRGDQIPGIQVNGMDVLSVVKAVEHTKQWVLDGKGPIILEFVTYRYGGHSMSDPGTSYRTREEIQRVRSTNDPIRGMQSYLADWGLATEESLKKLDKDAKAEVDAAVEEAKKAPFPPDSDLWASVYAEGHEPPFLRGRECEEVGRYESSL